MILISRNYDPGLTSRIIFHLYHLDFLPIPDPGVKKAPDPGSGTLATAIIYVHINSTFCSKVEVGSGTKNLDYWDKDQHHICSQSSRPAY
jgi:hypothetical protein